MHVKGLVNCEAFLYKAEHNKGYKSKKNIALAGVAQWIEHQPANQRVAGLIPSQGTAWVASQVPS